MMQLGDGSSDLLRMEQEVTSEHVSFELPTSCHPHRAPSRLPVLMCIAVTLALGCGGPESPEASLSPSIATDEPFESGPRVQPPEPGASPSLPPASSPIVVPSKGPNSSDSSTARPLPTPQLPRPTPPPTTPPLPTPRLPPPHGPTAPPLPTKPTTPPLPTPPLPLPSPVPTATRNQVDPSLTPP